LPYNPNSAYPRKTTYIPPTYGDHSFKRAVNGQDFSSQNTFGGTPFRPRGGAIYNTTIAEAAVSAIHPGAASGLAAASRHPITDKLSPVGERAAARGIQAVANVAVPAAQAAITGNVTPLVNRVGGAVANRVATRVLGGPMHGPKVPRAGMTHRNPAAIQTRAANVALSGKLGGMVLDGSCPATPEPPTSSTHSPNHEQEVTPWQIKRVLRTFPARARSLPVPKQAPWARTCRTSDGAPAPTSATA
jgi:hypothetical protein